MEAELDLLLGTAIDSLSKLEVLLYFHQRAGAVGSPEQVAAALRRPAPEIAAALEQLASDGLLERFPLGTGRHVIFGATEDTHVKQVLDLLYQRYHEGPVSRSQLVQAVLRAGNGPKEEGKTQGECGNRTPGAPAQTDDLGAP